MVWPRVPPPYGVYVSTVTFFDNDQNIDYRSISSHIKRLLAGGVTGLVVHGSNGESDYLTREERSAIVAHTKQACEKQGQKITIIAGCSTANVEQSLAYISDAREAGADYALVLPPTNSSIATPKAAIKSFYNKIATHSSLPVIIHDSAASASGIELDSDLIVDIFNSNNKNVVGIKSTSGDLTKLQRLSNVLPSSSFVGMTAQANFVLPILVADSNGVISTLANITPKLHCEVLRSLRRGELRQAQDLQAQLSDTARAMSALGVPGIKAALQTHFGYGSSRGRAPLPMTEADSSLAGKIRTIVELEKKLFSENKQQQTRL